MGATPLPATSADTVRCNVARWLDDQDADPAGGPLRDLVELATASGFDISADHLALVATRTGRRVSATAIRLHRRGVCACRHNTPEVKA